MVGYLDFRRKGAARAPGHAATAAPVPDRVDAPAPKPEATRAEPAPVLAADRRAALARLTVLRHAFTPAMAAAVADADLALIEALVAEGALATGADGTRLDLKAATRGAVAGELAPDDARAARLRHARHLVALAQASAQRQARSTATAPGGVAAAPVDPIDEELAHFEEAFAFLGGAHDQAALRLEFIESAGWGHALQLEPAALIAWAEAGLGAARTLRVRDVELDALSQLGGAYTEAGRLSEALGAYEQALAVGRELGDRLAEGRALGNRGLTRHRMGDAAGAIADYETVLGIMRELGDRSREAIALASLAQARADTGDHARALELFDAFHAIALEAGDRAGVVVALGNLGACHLALGDHARAVDVLEQQLQAALQLRQLPLERAALGGLGEACLRAGRLDRAVWCFSRQIEVAQMLDDARTGARAFGSLGLAHLAADRASRALECFEQQLQVARKVGDRDAEGHALWNAAKVVHLRGQVADAITRASAALPVLEETGSKDLDKLRAEISAWRARA